MSTVWVSDGFRCEYCVNVNGASYKVSLKLCASGAKIPDQSRVDLLLFSYTSKDSIALVCVCVFILFYHDSQKNIEEKRQKRSEGCLQRGAHQTENTVYFLTRLPLEDVCMNKCMSDTERNQRQDTRAVNKWKSWLKQQRNEQREKQTWWWRRPCLHQSFNPLLFFFFNTQTKTNFFSAQLPNGTLNSCLLNVRKRERPGDYGVKSILTLVSVTIETCEWSPPALTCERQPSSRQRKTPTTPKETPRTLNMRLEWLYGHGCACVGVPELRLSASANYLQRGNPSCCSLPQKVPRCLPQSWLTMDLSQHGQQPQPAYITNVTQKTGRKSGKRRLYEWISYWASGG